MLSDACCWSSKLVHSLPYKNNKLIWGLVKKESPLISGQNFSKIIFTEGQLRNKYTEKIIIFCRHPQAKLVQYNLLMFVLHSIIVVTLSL